MTCKTMKQNENDQNHKKESTPVVDDKPNGKSQIMLKFNKKFFLEFPAGFIVVASLIYADIRPAGAAMTTVNINGKNVGRTFEGIGAARGHRQDCSRTIQSHSRAIFWTIFLSQISARGFSI